MASHQECVLFGHLHVNKNIVPTCILVNHEFSILQYGGGLVFSDSKKFVLIQCVLFVLDYGQTKPKPKPRGAKKAKKLTAVEQEGESKCLFRATDGKKKLSTVVCLHYMLFSANNLYSNNLFIKFHSQ